MQDLREQYDAYISIGAHTDKKMGIEGEDSQGLFLPWKCSGKLEETGCLISRKKEWLSLAAVMWPWTVPDRLFVWEQIKLPVYTGRRKERHDSVAG